MNRAQLAAIIMSGLVNNDLYITYTADGRVLNYKKLVTDAMKLAHECEYWAGNIEGLAGPNNTCLGG